MLVCDVNCAHSFREDWEGARRRKSWINVGWTTERLSQPLRLNSSNQVGSRLVPCILQNIFPPDFEIHLGDFIQPKNCKNLKFWGKYIVKYQKAAHVSSDPCHWPMREIVTSACSLIGPNHNLVWYSYAIDQQDVSCLAKMRGARYISQVEFLWFGQFGIISDKLK